MRNFPALKLGIMELDWSEVDPKEYQKFRLGLIREYNKDLETFKATFSEYDEARKQKNKKGMEKALAKLDVFFILSNIICEPDSEHWQKWKEVFRRSPKLAPLLRHCVVR